MALAPVGEVVFLPLDAAVWEVVATPTATPSPKDEASYRIEVLERR